MKEVYVVNCCRTAVGSFGGSLKDTPATELGAVAVKEALNLLGMEAGPVRLPLCEMEEKNKARLRAAMQAKGLL